MDKIIDQWIKTDEKTNQSTLYTKYENRIDGKPLTPEQATQWMAENKF